jgi:hypothetical protein
MLAVACVACATQVPGGARLQIRLTGAINTANAKVDQQFGAVLIAPVMVGNQIVVATGVKVAGHIKEVTAALKSDDQALLALAFDRLTDSSGKEAPIEAKLVEVDNARESLDKDGRILGIIASQTGSGRLDQGINKVSEKYSGLGELLGTIKQAVLKEPDANIDYEAGVEMTIELAKALIWTGDARGANVSAIEPPAELADLVNAQPFRTAAVKPAKESDITNLMFLGSEEDLRKAFQAAGWSTAEQLNATSKLETFRAMAEQRGYKEAPVSVIFLNGRSPDLVFQKQNNTFNARHHLRIWRRPERFHGQPVWVCAATHDTGIDFSEESRTFIHKVDGLIDHERAKVANDLLFTGLVKGIALVERPSVPVSLFNATGDKITTDARMVVISF